MIRFKEGSGKKGHRRVLSEKVPSSARRNELLGLSRSRYQEPEVVKHGRDPDSDLDLNALIRGLKARMMIRGPSSYCRINRASCLNNYSV